MPSLFWSLDYSSVETLAAAVLVIIKSHTFFDKAEFCLTEYERRRGETRADQLCHAKQCMKAEEPDGKAGDGATALSQLLDYFEALHSMYIYLLVLKPCIVPIL